MPKSIYFIMTHYLFPHRFKALGLVLLITSSITGLLVLSFNYKFEFLEVPFLSIFQDNDFLSSTTNNLTDEILSLLVILGGILTGFSKEKIEDEYIAQIRLESLVWAFYFNFIILALAIILISGIAFLNVMIYNMFTILIFFVIRFNWKLYLTKKSTSNEE